MTEKKPAEPQQSKGPAVTPEKNIIASDTSGKNIPSVAGIQNKDINAADAPIINHFSALITSEQTLINNRITWMMTFQGFLFAAYAVAMSDQNDKIIRGTLYKVLPLVGMFVAFFTGIGVVAAISSIASIKSQFQKSIYSHWPAPYSNRFISFLGRAVAISFPIVIIITWVYIFSHYSPDKAKENIPPKQIEKTNDVNKSKPDTVKG